MKISAQFVKMSVLDIDIKHLSLHFNILFLFDVLDLTEFYNHVFYINFGKIKNLF